MWPQIQQQKNSDDELVYVMLYVATGEDLQCPAVPGVCLKI